MPTESSTRTSARMSADQYGLCAPGRRPRWSDNMVAVPVDHAGAEVREFLGDERRAGMMGGYATRLRSETECHRHVEIGERIHLPVEPIERIGTQTVGPRQPSSQVAHAEPPHPRRCVCQPMI